LYFRVNFTFAKLPDYRDMIELMLHPDPEKRGHLGMPNQVKY